MHLAHLVLNKNEERRLRAGHAWVFSNEICAAKSPLSSFFPGQQVTVVSHSGAPLGSAYVNPGTLISARLYTRQPDRILNQPLIQKRLVSALQAREVWCEEPYYRLVHGESDGLPGLVVDRYDDLCVVQISTAGMEAVKDSIVAALQETANPSTVIFKNDASNRKLEGLSIYCTAAIGELRERTIVRENGCEFLAPIASGQKTGWFFDHRCNRARLAAYTRHRRVLDVFSYVGAWAIQAAAAGAAEVTCVDSSSFALGFIDENSLRNNVDTRVKVLRDDAFSALKSLHSAGEKFDVVVLDPPAFIKRKKDLEEGMLAYQRLNALGMQLLTEGGLLVSASCSHHLTADKLLDILRRTSLRQHRNLQVLEYGQQAPDHPTHSAIPETSYLKTYFCRVVGEW